MASLEELYSGNYIFKVLLLVLKRYNIEYNIKR